MTSPALMCMAIMGASSLQEQQEDERRRKDQVSFRHIYGEEREKLTISNAVRYLYKAYGAAPDKKKAQEIIEKQWYVTQWQLDEIYYKWKEFCPR